jgi:HNH endonuclease.
MAFPENIKKIVKQKSCFRCVICHQPFVEIHHILPECEGGGDTEENAAPLCASCHDLYGGNPEKRKQIREMRNHWYELMERRYNGEINIFDPIKEQPSKIQINNHKGVAIYHYVYKHEDFIITANILFKLLQNAQRQFPDKPRHLYLDIEGHRNNLGGYDNDMFEIQRYFLLENFLKYFTEIHIPFGNVKNDEQNNIVPDELRII